MKKLCLFLPALVFIFSCTQPATTKDTTGSFSLDSVRKSIDANNRAFIEAIEKGDSTAIVAGYTSDACIFPDGGGPKMCGPDLIKFYGMTKQMGVHSLKINVTGLTGGKELVAEEGNYEIMDNAGKTMDKGRYLVTWKEENGVWKKHRDIWNTDMPPAK